MERTWNINKIYDGINSKEFITDKENLKKLIEDFSKIDYSKKNDFEVFKNAFLLDTKIIDLAEGMHAYFSLRLSANSDDTEALKQSGMIDSMLEESTMAEVRLMKYTIGFDSLLDSVEKDEDLKIYKYYIERMSKSANRLLSDETENIISKLEKSSGSAWERMFDSLTSTLEVDYKGKVVTLSEIRNMAYSPKAKVRKSAYEAEINSYKKIEKPIAQALSSIKEEVMTLGEAHGFKSPVDEVLDQTGMTKETLDALISSIEEYLPIFRTYLKRKGELLGHKNGLPFYDLFAPIGKMDKKFSVQDANEYLVSNFSKFNTEISSMMKKAMDNEWIDYFPRKGKVGGAFCEPVFKIKESRILTNFDGSFGDVVTLAHELGHAYHGELLWDYPILCSNYPMQLAETASTFNETFIKDYAMKNAKDKDELLFILENSIADDTQVIVDILSRYYFELSVFENSKESQLTPDELCDLMLDAQKRSYGDGLDKDYMHKYMWCCKGHYYSTGLSFYNFPYAFGQLFAYGLYAIYEEKGDEFFPLYKEILTNAGMMPIRECVMKAGIDVNNKDFWVKSLDLIKEKINKFLELTK